MIGVADTSPINYLILIQEIDILPKMYGTVVIPQTVREELVRPSAPQLVRSWIDHLPIWLEVRSPLAVPDSSLAKLDAGERDAITLATELHAEQLIVDDREGRREAERRGISVIGTLGVLREAATLRLLDIRIAVERLQATSFLLLQKSLQGCVKTSTKSPAGSSQFGVTRRRWDIG
jgi:predicted nucleic acid-binding protein